MRRRSRRGGPGRRPGGRRRQGRRAPRLAPLPRRSRRRLAAALLLFLLLGLSACGARRRRPDPDRPPLVGFSLDSLVVERWRRDIEVFGRSVRELGADFMLRVADQDPAIQESQVRELLDAGIDVLVIVPNDADRLSAVAREAKGRGVRVLSYDRLVRKAGVDLYISFDNEMVGALMAEAVSRTRPAERYVIINGARSDNNAHMLNAGMHRVLDPLVEAGKARIVAEIWPEEWDSEEVRPDFEALLSGGGRIDAVIAGNDMLAEAAIEMLSENRLSGSVRVAGQDAELAACQRIAEGSQYATVYKPIERLALKAAGFAVMLAKGEKIDAASSIDDGEAKVPYIRLEPILVTKELLEATVIKDGFHSAAEVYRNLPRP